ncbi:hypothetical protein RND71_022724 [Anisodus tanguticus]|uniref:Jacalin-type lectin domain-containing protein n=1 Tax=Anisodus tanguticus TaxID=243964 RepID=A0AAE1VD74_9SOLA|nr:hypothetical protein RND71_022724 [Anisodus tanguticus]
MDGIKVGPVGGRGGSYWDEKGGELAGIFVSYDEDTVYSLQFMYYKSGKLIMSDKYGGRQCESYSAIVLDYPSEFLTSISGSFERVKKSILLTSIQFGTNKGSYGPFGTPSTDGNVKQPSTMNCNGIESIGFYVKDIPSSVIKLKDSPVKVKKEREEKD